MSEFDILILLNTEIGHLFQSTHLHVPRKVNGLQNTKPPSNNSSVPTGDREHSLFWWSSCHVHERYIVVWGCQVNCMYLLYLKFINTMTWVTVESTNKNVDTSMNERNAKKNCQDCFWSQLSNDTQQYGSKCTKKKQSLGQLMVKERVLLTYNFS